ncbi:uncharacterized protein [Paramisgurnus dabryanus]|uniref:uncharacterized protein n=1 Tax=Paramisgurnus dabryanus TaxID=90735 RepID=UPI0031F3D3A2
MHAVAGCDFFGFCKGTPLNEWADPEHIRNWDNMDIIISVIYSFMMATTHFICNVEDSVESIQIPMDKNKFRLGVFYKVFVPVIILLVMGLIGGFIWMHLSYKDCPQCSDHPNWLAINATVTFDGKINFTAPKEGQYLIYGEIVMEEGKTHFEKNTIRLMKKSSSKTDDSTKNEITESLTFCHNKVQFFVDTELQKGEELLLRLNSKEIKIIETSSFLKIYEQNFDRCLY